MRKTCAQRFFAFSESPTHGCTSDVDVGVHLGSAVLKQLADGRERRLHLGGIAFGYGVGGGRQRRPDARVVGVKNEHRKDVAEQQPGRDQPNAAEHQ
jgi:hypothetical protein